eukprot:358472-Chlamydomonas_euryale.AAC.5
MQSQHAACRTGVGFVWNFGAGCFVCGTSGQKLCVWNFGAQSCVCGTLRQRALGVKLWGTEGFGCGTLGQRGACRVAADLAPPPTAAPPAMHTRAKQARAEHRAHTGLTVCSPRPASLCAQACLTMCSPRPA